MTTDIELVSTMDVSKENEAYNISEEKLPENTKIAAGSWLSSSGSHYQARLSVLRLIFSLIISKIPKFRFWYFIGDSTWQDDTRVVRHKRLWKALSSRGIEVGHSNETFEELIVSDGMLRFFGAKSISELSIESVVKALSEERCSYFLALPQDTDIKVALHLGWDVHDGFDKGLLRFSVENGGLLFKAIGEFDDPESGFVGLGEPELVQKLVE
ncbi:MAG: hypothetical protein KUG82_13895 [Pseudomonadales bacterium]|nr:hypothetical protein [Pseudomonadales bacterium]